MNQILLVEDEPDIQILIYTILTSNGFEVIKASSGEEGLILASKLNPDLIILDIVMPGLSGLEVCRLLKSKKDTKKTPVMIVTALNREVDRRYAEEYGADAYVVKPFKIERLLGEVDRLLH
jgi:two-component system phosphate regulon response regulator PhoB